MTNRFKSPRATMALIRNREAAFEAHMALFKQIKQAVPETGEKLRIQLKSEFPDMAVQIEKPSEYVNPMRHATLLKAEAELLVALAPDHLKAAAIENKNRIEDIYSMTSERNAPFPFTEAAIASVRALSEDRWIEMCDVQTAFTAGLNAEKIIREELDKLPPESRERVFFPSNGKDANLLHDRVKQSFITSLVQEGRLALRATYGEHGERVVRYAGLADPVSKER